MLTRPEAELRRESNGRESWVFRASHPRELLGIHAEKVGGALRAGEQLQYLLYSPMWEGSGGPFGIRAEPASHALAVTASRLIISRDPHADDSRPTLVSIPFGDVLCVESGSALILGWLVIHYAEAGVPRSLTVLYRALGRHHFTAALRASRLATRAVANDGQLAPLTWQEVWDQAGVRYREELEPLLTDTESPLAVMAWPSVYGRSRRRRSDGVACVTPAGALLVSTRGLFFIEDDPQALPRSPNFGVNVTCTRPDALQSVTLVDRTTRGPLALALLLHLDRAGAAVTFEVPFPGDKLLEIENILSCLPGCPFVKEIAWSL